MTHLQYIPIQFPQIFQLFFPHKKRQSFVVCAEIYGKFPIHYQIAYLIFCIISDFGSLIMGPTSLTLVLDFTNDQDELSNAQFVLCKNLVNVIKYGLLKQDWFKYKLTFISFAIFSLLDSLNKCFIICDWLFVNLIYAKVLKKHFILSLCDNISPNVMVPNTFLNEEINDHDLHIFDQLLCCKNPFSCFSL